MMYSPLGVLGILLLQLVELTNSGYFEDDLEYISKVFPGIL